VPAVHPPRRVVVAWGLGEDVPVLLPGGEGRTWRCGPLVLKPADHPAHADWLAHTLEALPQRGDVRVVRPAAALDGRYVVDGWTAWHWLDGEHRTDRWEDVLEAGDRFHAVVADVAWSPLLTPPSRWADADQLAWGDSERAVEPKAPPLLRRLLRARRPVDLPAQLVHGDLTGNVLLHDDLPPAVLDISPYWRPTGYAAAIVVADAIAWHGAPAALVEAHLRLHGDQLLLRALVFRLATDPGAVDRYARVATLVLEAV
jgi:uncharacterized protein (TIGR02569 family)